MGVVSTDPGYVLDDGKMPEPKVPIALAGRVPVKVSSKNGIIYIGDYLTASDIPGVAVRAITAGPVIGTAMEDYTESDPTQVGKITMFIKNTYIPVAPLSIAADGNLNSFSSPVSSEEAALALGLPGVPVQPQVVIKDLTVDSITAATGNGLTIHLGGVNSATSEVLQSDSSDGGYNWKDMSKSNRGT